MTIMAKILASLLRKYSTLQTAYDSVNLDRQTLENLKTRFISEEIRLELNNEGTIASTVLGQNDRKSSGKQTKKKQKR